MAGGSRGAVGRRPHVRGGAREHRGPLPLRLCDRLPRRPCLARVQSGGCRDRSRGRRGGRRLPDPPAPGNAGGEQVRPVLFQIPTPFGTFPVSSFGIFLLLAFIAAILETRTRTRRLGWDPGEVVDLSLYAIIGGIVGARLGYVLVNLRDFAAAPQRGFMIWVDAGLTFYGALLGGALVAWVYGRKRDWRLPQIADAAAPGLALGYAIAMIGALLYGLNYGRPTHVPWAVMLFGEPRHPTQLYLTVAALAVYVVLLVADRTPHPPGRQFWLFVLLMAVTRIG